jgi:hypothetical protein
MATHVITMCACRRRSTSRPRCCQPSPRSRPPCRRRGSSTAPRRSGAPLSASPLSASCSRHPPGHRRCRCATCIQPGLHATCFHGLQNASRLANIASAARFQCCHWQANLQALQVGERSILPFLLVCITTGLWASQLASLVSMRLFEARPAAVVHTVALLAIFGAAAFKQEHTGMLAMTLPALLCAAPSLARACPASVLLTRHLTGIALSSMHACVLCVMGCGLLLSALACVLHATVSAVRWLRVLGCHMSG